MTGNGKAEGAGTSADPWVLVASGFHRNGGMDKANLALAEYLVEIGADVHLVCHSADQDFSNHPLVTVYQVPCPAGSFLLGEPLIDRRGRAVAHQITSQFPRATVVVNGGNCIWPGVNWIHYVHHAWESPVRTGPPWFAVKSAVSNWFFRRQERLAFRKAKLLITNSDTTTKHLIEHLEVDPGRIRRVYLGGEAEWGMMTPEQRAKSRVSMRLPPSRLQAVFVGALGYDRRKGFDVLFEAWKVLCNRPEWDVDLLVAGSGNALNMWHRVVSEAGLQDRIRLLGFSRDVPNVLAAADLLVSPVRYEPYGLNVQEAICRGIPAMVSARAGIAERYGRDLLPMLILDPEDAGDLVEQLLAWRLRKEEWIPRFRALGETLRARTWRDMATEIVSTVRQQKSPLSNSTREVEEAQREC